MASTPDPFDAYPDPRDNEAEALRLIRAVRAGAPPKGITVAPWSGRIFGFPGDGINGIMGALNRHQDLIDFIQVRHRIR